MTDTPKRPDSAVEVITQFLMNWDIEDFGSAYTAERLAGALENAGYAIVPIEPTNAMTGAKQP